MDYNFFFLVTMDYNLYMPNTIFIFVLMIMQICLPKLLRGCYKLGFVIRSS